MERLAWLETVLTSIDPRVNHLSPFVPLSYLDPSFTITIHIDIFKKTNILN